MKHRLPKGILIQRLFIANLEVLGIVLDSRDMSVNKTLLLSSLCELGLLDYNEVFESLLTQQKCVESLL